MKIVLAEKTSPAAVKIFQLEKEWSVITADQIKNGLEAEIVDADALIVRSAIQVDEALLAHAKKLRVIGRAGVGVDNIDTAAAGKRNIIVMNTPGANAVAVAEHTFGLMLAMARSLVRADVTTREGKWEKKTLLGSELRGKTLGIIGLGRIGVEVAKRATVFGMTVLANDPAAAPELEYSLNLRLVSRDEVFESSDYISLHVALTPKTQNMIDEAAIEKMKKGVRIINCARGELIVDAALAAALQSGKVAGAALDVFTEEPPKGNVLFTAPNLIATPHIAGSTTEAQEAVGTQIAHQVMDYLRKGVIVNAVNAK